MRRIFQERNTLLTDDTPHSSAPAICFVTTVSATLDAFVLPSAEYLHRFGGFDVTVVAKWNQDFAEHLPGWVRYVPVDMKRGIELGGLRSTARLVEIFRSGKFDIVQFSTPNASLYASLAAASTRVPLRIYAQWGIRYVGFTGLKRVVFKTIEKLVCRLATHIEPDSFGNLKFATSERLYPESKGHVVWNGSASGVDLERFDVAKKSEWREIVRLKHIIPDRAFVVGFVGRLSRDKGGNELLQAAQYFLSKIQESRLLLVGSVEEKGIAADLLAWARSHPRVIFTGQTPDVPQYISAMDIFVLPSYREGFGSVVIEAEAMGVPVIVTDIPGPLDAMVPNKTGLVIPPRDWSSLADVVVKLSDQPHTRFQYGESGIEYARNNFERNKFGAQLMARRTYLLDLHKADLKGLEDA